MENSNNSSVPSSAGGVGSPSNSGSDSGEVDDAQDEEPSSSINHPVVESELDNFRQQWKREIEFSPIKEGLRGSFLNQPGDDADSVEERARKLFLHGIQAEQNGKLQDAIALYRRAVQLVPDIEFRINESIRNRDEFSDESEDESSTLEEDSYSSDDGDDTDNLVDKFQKVCAKVGSSRICQPKVEPKVSHISDLPPEVFLYILKWVVSQDLDIFSLEQVARVCRGFYILARDPEIWKLVCLRTWDVNIDTPNRYGSWRNMFIQRPHLSFNGVYISKTTYVRYGESSFQDTNYRPCYLVEYYRYLRFFPDGIVLMLTTPDDPYRSLYKLRYRKSKFQNVMCGRYKLIGSTIMAVVKNLNSEPASNFYRYRRQRQANVQELQDQTFHLELEVKNVKKRINCQLSWKRYSIHVIYRNGEETISNFDLIPSNYPSFWFSRVRSFAEESESPLN